MKKLLTVTLTLLMLISYMGITALAEGETLSANVYVTIADKDGKLALAQKKITVTDTDNDGALTVNDALFAAHEAKYEGGAAVGYESANTEYGLSLNKLWGTANGGSYGYIVNNVSAWSLLDAVKEGDYVSAYVYTDLTAWSDTYCYFNVNTATATAGEQITLTLTANGFDAQYNPITVPVEGATITLNGEKTEFKIDKDGKATVTVAAAGDYIISAVSDTLTLVPPVCKATVTAAANPPVAEPETKPETTPEATPETKPEAAPETAPKTQTEELPKTGDNSNLNTCFVIMLVSLSVAITLLTARKRFYE